MDFDFEAMAPDSRYKILTGTIVPRPIAWITTLSADGVRNAAPFSFFNAMGKDPPLVAVGIQVAPDGGLKDTARNIIETGEFVVNLVSEDLAAGMNATSVAAPPDVDELVLVGLEVLPSRKVRPPRIAASRAAFECKVHTPLSFTSGQFVVLGEVLHAHIGDAYIIDRERHHVHTAGLNLIGRLEGPGWYSRTTDRFALERPSQGRDAKRGS